MLERWTRTVLRLRFVVLALWLAVLVGGAYSAHRLPALLSNSFAVPETESERAREILGRDFGEQPEGTFIVVFEVTRSSKELEGDLHRRVARAAKLVPTGRADELRDGDGILYGEIDTTLDLAEAKRYTGTLRRSLGAYAGPRTYVTGQPAIQHDLDPILSHDLRRAELVASTARTRDPRRRSRPLPCRRRFPSSSRPARSRRPSASSTLLAHIGPMTTYVTDLVELIGLGLAIDYSLLIVLRFREEAAGERPTDEAVVRTMATAGRAVVSSGLAVALGLAVLLFVPVPFIRSLGVGGLLVPLVSIAAVLTLQPALLSVFGERGTRRLGELPQLGGGADVITRRRRVRLLGAARRGHHATRPRSVSRSARCCSSPWPRPSSHSS